jgi:NAD(P)-dependent dehydrogenase (short-subunit alcohol dehydrogenase family)
VSKSADLKRLFDEAERAFSGIDLAVNNAGRAIHKPLAEFSEAEFGSAELGPVLLRALDHGRAPP